MIIGHDINNDEEIVKLIIKYLFTNPKEVYKRFKSFCSNNTRKRKPLVKLLEEYIKYIKENNDIDTFSKLDVCRLDKAKEICEKYGIDFNPDTNLYKNTSKLPKEKLLKYNKNTSELIEQTIKEYLKNIPIKKEDKDLFREIESNLKIRRTTILHQLAILLLCFKLNGRVYKKRIGNRKIYKKVDMLKYRIEQILREKGFDLTPRYENTKKHWIKETIDNFYYFIKDERYKEDLDKLIENILDFLKDPETGEYIDFLDDVTKYPLLIGILTECIVASKFTNLKDIINDKLELIVGKKIVGEHLVGKKIYSKIRYTYIKENIKENFMFICFINRKVCICKVPYITKELLKIIEKYNLRCFIFEADTLEHRVFRKLIELYNLKINEISDHNNENKFIYLVYSPKPRLSYKDLKKSLLEIYGNMNIVYV